MSQASGIVTNPELGDDLVLSKFPKVAEGIVKIGIGKSSAPASIWPE